jgi:forkhead box protein J2/3
LNGRFDPNFIIAPGGIRFPPHVPPYVMGPDERLEVDESGSVSWRLQWIKELGHLQNLTQQQEKDGAAEEWYRMMFFRLRGALLAPITPGDAPMAPHQMLPPQGNPVDQQQQ